MKAPEEFEFVRPVPGLGGTARAALICAKESSGDVVALSAATGAPLWKYRSEGSGGALGPPALCEVDGKVTLVLKFSHGKVEALDGKTGQPLWRIPVAREGISGPVFHRPVEVTRAAERHLLLCPEKDRYLSHDARTGGPASPDLDLAGTSRINSFPTFAPVHSGGPGRRIRVA